MLDRRVYIVRRGMVSTKLCVRKIVCEAYSQAKPSFTDIREEKYSSTAPARTHLDHVLGLSVVVVAARYFHASVLHRQKVDLGIILGKRASSINQHQRVWSARGALAGGVTQQCSCCCSGNQWQSPLASGQPGQALQDLPRKSTEADENKVIVLHMETAQTWKFGN